MSASFVPVRVTRVDRAELSWAEGRRFTLPQTVLDRPAWRGCVSSTGDVTIPDGDSDAGSSDASLARQYAAYTDAPPASSRLPFRYHAVPSALRMLAASAVGRFQRGRADTWAAFPGWPLDLTADLLSDLAREPRVDFGGRTPVLLTHDIDSPEGLANLVARFLPIEEAAQARSTSFIVPCGWPLDEAAIDDARRRGHEIGVHGYDHSNRTPFAAAEERRRRIDAALPFATRFGAIGYRAPSLLRTRALLSDLATRYSYDSSIPTSGGLFPVPNNGCASARPYAIDGLVEIPLSLPRDGSLRFLGHTPAEILRLWADCADLISSSGGVVVLLTHCETRFSGNPAMLDAYSKFVEYVSAHDKFSFTTPAALMSRLQTALDTSSATRSTRAQ